MPGAFDPDDVSTRLASVARQAGAGVALFDPQDRLRFANAWYQQTFGADPVQTPTWDDIMRRCHRLRQGVLIETDDIEAWLAEVKQRYRGRPVRSFASDLVDGRWIWVTESLQPDGWLLTLLVDVSPLKASETSAQRARDEAVRLSLRDPLTDLFNRRHLFDRLHSLLDDAHAMRWPLTVAMLDIDHFKHINDTRGHATGDAVLRHFASALQHQTRPKDVVGRIGGEEFLILLPNATLDGASATMQRIRSLIDGSAALADAGLPAYGFSAGLATAQPGDTADSLIKRADDAMYQAKREGRNRDWGTDSRSMRL